MLKETFRAWKVAPALACGCTIVMKPSEFTPLTALVSLHLACIAEIAASCVFERRRPWVKLRRRNRRYLRDVRGVPMRRVSSRTWCSWVSPSSHHFGRPFNAHERPTLIHCSLRNCDRRSCDLILCRAGWSGGLRYMCDSDSADRRNRAIVLLCVLHRSTMVEAAIVLH